MLHIGFLTSDLTHRHGWGHYSLSLIRALREAGVQVTVIASRNSPPLDDLPAYPILPAIDPRESNLPLKLAASAPRVRQLLRACDLIHAAIEPYAILGAWTADHRPLFITGHGSYVRMGEMQRWPLNRFYQQAFRRGLLVCVSHYTARVAQTSTPGVRTAVVNNGIDLGRFAVNPIPSASLPLALRGSGGERFAESGPVVLTVGAIKERKGTLELARAMAAVRQKVPGAQCILIGSRTMEPDYAARVQAEIDHLGLADCVKLLGVVPEEALLGWYSAADLFVLPSLNVDWKFEGYGLSLIEASAAGLPVIGTTDCGAEDAIVDGVTGLLLPQSQLAEALPQAIIRLLTDPAQAARMGQAGRAKAQTQTWGHVAQQMIELYRKALDNSGL